MILQERIPLRDLTTFKVGGDAAYVAECTSEADVLEALNFARERNLPFYVLGQGSNVLPSDEGFRGVVIRIRIPGVSFMEENGMVLVRAGAGASWDELVAEVAERGLWGIENLAGIPGTCGAAPVQNIGAYGMELKDTLRAVQVLDATTGGTQDIAVVDCALSYRDSLFKHTPQLIITQITLALSKQGAPKIEYGDLLRAQEAGEDLSTPTAIGAVVRKVRAGKFPDLATAGTAGSFFKNPIISPEKYQELRTQYGEVPQFPNPKGIKVPLAFILDKVLGLRGFRLGPTSLFGSQPLVLVADIGARAADVEALATEVEKRVVNATQITIEREVRSMPEE